MPDSSIPTPDAPASSLPPGGPKQPHRLRKVAWAAASLVGAAVVAFGVCEWMGWPFLAGPVERSLSMQLDRPVSFSRDSGGATANTLRIHLLGGVRVNAGSLRIGAPAWSPSGDTLQATDAELLLRYRDLWALYRGQGLRVKSLRAAHLNAVMERLPDGRASWQFGPANKPSDDGTTAPPPLRFDRLEVAEGQVKVADAVMAVTADVTFGLRDSNGTPAPAAATSRGTLPSAASGGAAGDAARGDTPLGMHAEAKGRYRNNPLTATLSTGSVLPWVSGDANAPAISMQLQMDAGPARARFEGSVRELIGLGGLQGTFLASGPSLASFGEPLGVTLPTTAPFRLEGSLSHAGTTWKAAVRRGTVGRSHLNGEFSFDTRDDVPMLAGRLGGSNLVLADLAPAIGAAPPGEPAPPRKGGKVLPDKRFDLPSLRAMDADVRVDLQRVELGSAFAEPLTPLQGHLQLKDGVLSLTDLLARTAQGRITGEISLDGRPQAALWQTRLQWSGLTLEQWIKQARSPGQPPYATGRIGGRLDLKGQGRSTAELLASAQGKALVHWTRGSVSHLAVEAGGIDVAQALGVLVKGDESLPVQCGAADLQITQGLVTPKVMLVDTRDSTVWVDGQLSLATEALDLRARVSPKDFSPLALRTPIHLKGQLGDPDISLEKGPLLKRLVPAALLATAVAPLAAMLPLLDMGDPSDAAAALEGCRKLIDSTQTRQPPAKAS